MRIDLFFLSRGRKKGYIWVEAAVTQVDEMLHLAILFYLFHSGTKAWFVGTHRDCITRL